MDSTFMYEYVRVPSSYGILNKQDTSPPSSSKLPLALMMVCTLVNSSICSAIAVGKRPTKSVISARSLSELASAEFTCIGSASHRIGTSPTLLSRGTVHVKSTLCDS